MYVVRNELRSQGFEVIRLSRRTKAESLLGLHLARLFELYNVTVVLDVGARQGEYARWLRNNGFAGHIVSFEPVTDNFDVLRRNAIHDPKWTIHQLALGSSDGSATINVTRQTQFSSFLSPNSYATSHFGEGASVAKTETVSVSRLDSVFETVTAHVTSPNVFLKMDTQGWDLEVLAGADGSLASIAALQSEVSVQPLYEDMPRLSETLASLSALGFDVSGLFPVNLDHRMAVIEFDCVAVRRVSPDPPLR